MFLCAGKPLWITAALRDPLSTQSEMWTRNIRLMGPFVREFSCYWQTQMNSVTHSHTYTHTHTHTWLKHDPLQALHLVEMKVLLNIGVYIMLWKYIFVYERLWLKKCDANTNICSYFWFPKALISAVVNDSVGSSHYIYIHCIFLAHFTLYMHIVCVLCWLLLPVCNFLRCCLGQISFVKEIFDLKGTYLVKYGLNK